MELTFLENLENYRNFGKLAVGNNKINNMGFQDQFYFYFDFPNFRVGRARKTTNQILTAVWNCDWEGNEYKFSRQNIHSIPLAV